MAEAFPRARAGCGDSETAGAPLKNRIFIVRHGESEANVVNMIVSSPDVGINFYGLTVKGKQQAKEASETLRSMLHSEHCLPEKLVIVSSDFKRAGETADILHSQLQVKTPLRLEPGIRARDFGRLHMTETENYRRVWDLDAVDPTHTDFGNESLMDIVMRASRFIQSLDEEFTDKIIVLVSHGDVLRIVSTLFLGLSPSEYTTLPELYNCEIRELKEVVQ